MQKGFWLSRGLHISFGIAMANSAASTTKAIGNAAANRASVLLHAVAPNYSIWLHSAVSSA